MDADPDDATWRYDWPAGGRLLAELDQVVDPRGLSVIDLGCGSGRLGMWAHQRGAARVVFADLSPTALAAVRARLPTAETLVHRWGEALPTADLVLGGDILYRPALFPALIGSLVSALAGGGTALLADPRTRLEADLPALCAQAGLTWTTERRGGAYTLARVRLAVAI